MFERKMKPLKVYKPIETINSYKEKITEYTYFNTAEIVISLTAQNRLFQNSTSLIKCDYTGFTKNQDLVRGMLIDSKFKVEHVVSSDSGLYLLLSEVRND